MISGTNLVNSEIKIKLVNHSSLIEGQVSHKHLITAVILFYSFISAVKAESRSEKLH